MSAARRAPFLPPGSWPRLAALGCRLGGLALVGLGVAGLLALLSYHPADPSLNTVPAAPDPATQPGDGVVNLIGRPGAYVADLLLQGLGVAGALPALAALTWGSRLAAGGTVGDTVGGWWLRLLGLVGLCLAAALAVAPLLGDTGWPVDAGPGGVAGRVLFEQSGQLAEALGLASGLRWLTVPLAAVLALALVAPVLAVGRREVDGARDLWQRGRAGLGAARAALADLPGTGRAMWAGLTARLAGGRPPPPPRREPHLDEDEDTAETEAPAIGEPPPRRRKPRPRAVVDPPPKQAPPSRREMAARQGSLLPEPDGDGPTLPPLDLLALPKTAGQTRISQDALAENARLLESVLAEYGVKGEIVKVRPGPVVTLYELEPAPGTKTSRVIGLADDIARSMSAVSVRIAVVPGRSVIGIELPNLKRQTVYLRELLAAEAFESAKGGLTLALGKDIGGTPVLVDLARMPHLLIAGTTGSGKSVAVNTMILSLLYRLSPEQCRFIMIDPKMLELSAYDGIPHLLAPVVTDPGKAVVALKWAVREMEDRYRAMSQLGVRNIAGYNQKLTDARARGENLKRTVQTGFDPETGQPIHEEQPLDMTPLPFIVVIVDEMADLMLVAGKDVEACIQRLAQMARAAGIHLIMATQRPSVDVITGTIKANFPTRISFQVTSKIDSRTILGEQGAEQLLGQGDMLYMAAGGRIQRVHGPFASDQEVEEVTAFLASQGEPDYLSAVTEEGDDAPPILGLDGATQGSGGNGDSGDALFDQAVALVARERKASTSFVQRHLQIGYNRAARIIERMEAEGMVGKPNHVGKREVLLPPSDE
ncbi:FtsK/SpoIIIE family DNA translocase [Roseospirillum parvum]|uniref:DNA translocase FtsK n=1 Tax=Roseospirillum parvum TaxID=83401 RepID=A0A1G7Z8M9_9PROT|nr:DNA translocase FtsK 4TM domain-containing protein [Roseospirillum parvum]SDH05068.1 DNA segregation ATPase FtsK/SpoIIIE, S-DNA-T family [Roseospirillum parvum]